MTKGFTPTKLKVLRAAMQKALEEAGIEDITFEIGNCRYDDGEATFKVAAKLDGVKSRKDVALEKQMKIYGLKEEGRDGAKLVSYNSRSYKYPFVYEKGGKRWKCGSDQAKYLFGA